MRQPLVDLEGIISEEALHKNMQIHEKRDQNEWPDLEEGDIREADVDPIGTPTGLFAPSKAASEPLVYPRIISTDLDGLICKM